MSRLFSTHSHTDYSLLNGLSDSDTRWVRAVWEEELSITKHGTPSGLMQKRFQYAPRQEEYNLELYTDCIFLLTEGTSLTTLSPLCVLSVKLMWEP